MSSVRISVSGQRALTTTIGDQAQTCAQAPTKPDDNIVANFGSLAETRMFLPKNARLERVKFRDHEQLRLVIPAGGSLQIGSFKEFDENGNPVPSTWSHVNVEVGKHLDDYYADAEVIEVLSDELGKFMPPTDGDGSEEVSKVIPERVITKAQAAMNACLTVLKSYGGDDTAVESAQVLCREGLESLAAHTR